MSKRPAESRSERRHAALKEKRSKPLCKVDAPHDLALATEPQRAVEGADPYNLVSEKTQITDQVRRRSLDDMRRLSEAIKNTPQWAPPQKTTRSALYRELSELRTALERALAEIKAIREGAADTANDHVVELAGELRNVAYHLEGALISLRAASGLTSTAD